MRRWISRWRDERHLQNDSRLKHDFEFADNDRKDGEACLGRVKDKWRRILEFQRIFWMKENFKIIGKQ